MRKSIGGSVSDSTCHAPNSSGLSTKTSAYEWPSGTIRILQRDIRLPKGIERFPYIVRTYSNYDVAINAPRGEKLFGTQQVLWNTSGFTSLKNVDSIANAFPSAQQFGFISIGTISAPLTTLNVTVGRQLTGFISASNGAASWWTGSLWTGPESQTEFLLRRLTLVFSDGPVLFALLIAFVGFSDYSRRRALGLEFGTFFDSPGEDQNHLAFTYDPILGSRIRLNAASFEEMPEPAAL